jgi:hypothetical protein
MAVAHIACLRPGLKQKCNCCERFAARVIDGCKGIGWEDGALAGEDRRIILDHREQRRHAFLRA